MAAFHESPAHVVVEFLKSSGTDFGSRAIRLNHRKSAVPPQLFARVDPRLWATFMGEVEHLAANHPYVQQPGAGKVAGWAAGCAVGSVLGFCCIDPDGGDYGQWEGQLRELVDRYAGYFAQAGCSLSLHATQRRRDYWLEIDVQNPQVWVGKPVALGQENGGTAGGLPPVGGVPPGKEGT